MDPLSDAIVVVGGEALPLATTGERDREAERTLGLRHTQTPGLAAGDIAQWGNPDAATPRVGRRFSD